MILGFAVLIVMIGGFSLFVTIIVALMVGAYRRGRQIGRIIDSKDPLKK